MKFFLLFQGKFGQKYQNYLLQMKFGIKVNSRMPILIVILTFSVLELNMSFLGKFGPNLVRNVYMKVGT